MNNHFVLGFTIKDHFHNSLNEKQKKNQQNQRAIDLEHESIDAQDQSDDMLFKIGSKHLGQQQVINIDEQSYQSDDSDRTVNLKQEKKKDKKPKKQKKQKKHQQKHKEKHKKHKKDKNHEESQSHEQQEGQLDDENSLQKVKKEKKIKKHKEKHHKKQKERDPSPEIQQVKHLSSKKDNKQVQTLVQVTESKPLFPSLINKPTQSFISASKSLVRLPSHLKPYTTNSKQAQLYNSYLDKLTESNLLPSRTIRQLSSQIVQKSQEFAFLYKNDSQRFDKESSQNFITNAKLPDYLRCDLKFDIVRFPIKQLYTYGKHMDKDIPKYELIHNFTKVIGVKDKKQLKYQKLLKDIYRQLNQNDYSYQLKGTKDKGNYDRYFHYEGYENIQGATNLIEKRDKLELMRNKYPKKIFSKQTDSEVTDYRLIAFETQNKLFSLDHELQMLQSSEQEKLKQKNRELTQALLTTPKNTQLWLKLVELQDQLYSLNIYGVLSSGNTNQNPQKHLKIGGFITEKKLSILAKALQHNPLDEVLGLHFLKLMFTFLKQPQAKLQALGHQFNSIQKIETSFEQYIKRYPTNHQFWLLYLELKLEIEPFVSMSLNFNHTYIKHIFKQISTKITNLISTQKSAQTIIRLRSISLLVLQKIMSFYHKQGYTELTLAIGVALVEFNLFVPQRVHKLYSKQNELESKKKQFMKYWEEYNEEKIGDLKWSERRSWEIWDHERESLAAKKVSQNIDSGDFKGQQERKIKVKSLSYIDQQANKVKPSEISLMPSNNKEQTMESIEQQHTAQKLWHFACPLYNRQRIKQSIESLVLYQDIDQWLMNYRDTESIVKVVNMLVVQGLGMKKVFSFEENRDIQSQEDIPRFQPFIKGKFTHKLQSLAEKISVNKSQNLVSQADKNILTRENIIFSSKLSNELFEQEYWPPQMTISFFGLNFIKKMVYLSRVLRVLSQKLYPVLTQQKSTRQIYEFNEYRIFLLGCISLIRIQLKNYNQVGQKEKQIFENITEEQDGIKDEIEYIMGWWETHKSTIPTHKNGQPVIDSSLQDMETPYDQARLWTMYIEFEWMKCYYGMDKSMMIGKDQIFKNTAAECLACYSMLLVSVVNEKSTPLATALLTLRYYHLFIIAITTKNEEISEEIKLNFMKLISLFMKIRKSDPEENQVDPLNQVNKITDSLKLTVIDHLELCSQGNDLIKIEKELQRSLTSPIHRLQLINCIEELYNQLSNQNTFKLKTNACQLHKGQLILIIQWLTQLVSAYSSLGNPISSNQNTQVQNQMQEHISQSNAQNSPVCSKGQDLCSKTIDLYSKRMQSIHQKTFQTMNIIKNKKQNLTPIVQMTLVSLIGSSNMVFRIWKYLKLNLADALDNHYLLSTYEQLLLLRLRTIQEMLQQIDLCRRMDLKGLGVKRAQIEQILGCKLRQFYNKKVRMLKSISFNTAVSSSHSNKRQSFIKSKDYETRSKKDKRKGIQTQEYLVSMIQLTISLLNCISKDLQDKFSQQVTALKQILSQLLIKYPYCKQLYLHYLTLIQIQIYNVKRQQFGQISAEKVKRTNQLNSQIDQVHERMNSYGIRIILKHPK